VSTERIYYCDGPECERHVRTASRRPTSASGFVFVSDGGSITLHFCGWDCVLKYAAMKPPEEVVSVEG
jgi:hypothetical protein